MLSGNAVVLLVDDQPIVAAALRKMLSSEADLTFHYCQDPASALVFAEKHEVTVILQDLIMDGVSGFEMLERFRANAPTANVPIIVLSSKEDPRDKREAFEKGSNDYLVKIPDKIELIARIRAHSKSYMLQRERDAAFAALQAIRLELEAKNVLLERLSAVDGLTGLANRRRFDEALSHEWQRARRNASSLGVILVDVDHFKKYNDHYGHLQGDDCLRKVATAMGSAIKRPADLVARYGGEEFVVLVPETDGNGLAHVAEHIRLAVENLQLPHAGSDVFPFVTISLGSMVTLPKTECGQLELLTFADQALYQSKRGGRNRHTMWKEP
jgi:two-component system, chemotaxis family, response regulator WspR